MKAHFGVFLLACSAVYTECYALPTVVDNSMYPPSAAPITTTAPASNTVFELMGRMEQLQAEVQQLTGKVEEQANLISELKKQQGTMYSDFDDRLQGLENKAGSTQPAADNTQEPPLSGEEAKPVDEQATTPAPVTAPEASEPVQEDKPATEAKDASPAEQPAPVAVQAPDGEKQEYQQAYEALRHGHTSQSITELNAYLEKYPNGAYSNNAQYWLGEAYRVNQDNDSARKAFNDVLDKYPKSAKVPDALLKLGYIEVDQKNTAKAREYLTRVTADFPNTPAARLAEKKLQLLDNAPN